MKTISTIFLCFVILFTSCFGANAYDGSSSTSSQVTQITTNNDSGITIIDELVVQDFARSSTRTATRTKTYLDGDTTIAVIALTATFSYSGSSVSVLSKEISRCDTYKGWSFAQNSLSSSGGTATLTGRLTRILSRQVSVNISITCDKNGNIS